MRTLSTITISLLCLQLFASACAKASDDGTPAERAPTIAYATSSLTVTQNIAMTTLNATLGGGSVTACSANPSLPVGLSVNSTTCSISGTPVNTQAATAYTITASNAHGSAQAALTITIQHISIEYSGSAYNFSKNLSITTITPSLAGGTPTSCSSSPALPGGITINATTCAISGTPTDAQASTAYTITASNASGSGQTSISIAVGEITISPTSGPIGTLITVTGTNYDLSGLTAVTINGSNAIVVSRNVSTASVLVMPSTTTGQLVTTAPGGTQSTGFNVTTVSAVSAQQGLSFSGTGNGGNANQGCSIAISADGNTAIVGGKLDNLNQGAAWIFTRTGTTWTQQGTKLVGTGGSSNAEQGHSVAISADGNTALIGGRADNSYRGAVWVFTRSGTTWSQQGSKLVGTGSSTQAEQGSSVAISADGNTALVGAWQDNGAQGSAWVFTRSGSTWSQQGTKLSSASFSNYFGYAVALAADGNTAIIGSYGDSGTWVFVRSGSTWTQQGTKLVGTGNVGDASQGWSVALSADGNTAVVGGFGDNSNTGAAWVYTRSGTTWTQQGSKLVGTGSIGAARQGFSVSISADGNTALLGGSGDNSNRGATWVFTRNGSTWSQQGNKLVGTGGTADSTQGRSVALSADTTTAIIGGSNDSSGHGRVWVFVP